MNRHRLIVAALPVIAAFALAACGSGRASARGMQSAVLAGGSWQTTLERARGHGLLAYARAHPGRVTHPAPPDFTGSAFVCFVVQIKGEAAAFAYLRELQPLLWRGGRSHPKSEAELNRLFGDSKVDLAMSYDPGLVQTAVRQGTFAPSARPRVLEGRTLQNVSFVTPIAEPPASRVTVLERRWKREVLR